MVRRPWNHPCEVSIQWLKTTTCRKAGPELGQSCLRTTLSFLAPYYPDPDGALNKDEKLKALIAHSDKPGCGCLPPLLFAVDQLALVLFSEGSGVLKDEAEVLRDLITCLVQHGANFNQPATLFIGNGQVRKTTPRQHFVSLFSARVDDAGWWADAEFAGQTLGAVEEFLEAGAHVTEEDLVSFFPIDFIMSNPEGDLVLGEVREDEDDGAITPVPGTGLHLNSYGLPVNEQVKDPAPSPSSFDFQFDEMSLDERPDVQVACVTPEGVTTMDNGGSPLRQVTLRGQFQNLITMIARRDKKLATHGLHLPTQDDGAVSCLPIRVAKSLAEDAELDGDGRVSAVSCQPERVPKKHVGDSELDGIAGVAQHQAQYMMAM